MPNRTTTEALKRESPGVNRTGGAPHRRTSALLALLWCGLMPLPVHPQTNATPAAAQTERASVGVARLDSLHARAPAWQQAPALVGTRAQAFSRRCVSAGGVVPAG